MLRVGTLDDVGALLGYADKQFAIIYKEKEITVSEKTLEYYLKAGAELCDKKPTLTYAIPEWVEYLGDSGLLLIDDSNRGLSVFKQGVMHITEEGKYHSWTLGKDVHIFITNNFDNGLNDVSEPDEAQVDRYGTITMEFDVEAWIKDYASKQQIPSECINFILMNPELVKGGKTSSGNTSIRRWCKFFRTLMLVTDYRKSMEYIKKKAETYLNDIEVSAFLSFISNNYTTLPDIPKLLNKNIDEIIPTLYDVINKPEYNQPVANVLATRLKVHLASNVTTIKTGLTPELLSKLTALLSSKVFPKDIVTSILYYLYLNCNAYSILMEEKYGGKEFNLL